MALLDNFIEAFIRAYDPSQNGTCTTCDSETPCCVTSLTIQDKAGKNRKIEWPIVDGHDKLLIIADKTAQAKLYGEVAVEWQGSSCKLYEPDMPCIRVDPSHGWTDYLFFNGTTHTQKKFDTQIGCKDIAYGSYLTNLVPDTAQPYFTAFDIIMNFDYFLEMLSHPTSFKAKQCHSGKDGTPVLMVTAVPRFEMSGKITLSCTLILSTVGINVSYDFQSELTAKIGSLELGRTTAKSPHGEHYKNNKYTDGNKKPKGLLGGVAEIADKIFSTVDDMKKKRTTKKRKSELKDQAKIEDLKKRIEKRAKDKKAAEAAEGKGQAEFATNITIQPALTLECKGIELKTVDNAPDLALHYGNASAELSVSVSGQLNILEILAYYFLGLGKALVEAQEAMAKGEQLTVIVETKLKVSGKGSVKYSASLSGKDALIIKPDGTFDASKIGLTYDLDGAIRIVGEGIIKIQIGVKVWVFDAEAGSEGAVYLAWTWQWKMLKKDRKKRSYFEGMYGVVYVYCDAKVNDSDEDGDTTTSSKKAIIKKEFGTKIITNDIDKPLTNQARDANNPTKLKKLVYEIVKPTTETITDKEPKWNDFN